MEEDEIFVKDALRAKCVELFKGFNSVDGSFLPPLIVRLDKARVEWRKHTWSSALFVCGPVSGCGKTRLLQQVALEWTNGLWSDRFDAVFFATPIQIKKGARELLVCLGEEKCAKDFFFLFLFL